jgi:acetyl esterase/lipase
MSFSKTRFLKCRPLLLLFMTISLFVAIEPSTAQEPECIVEKNITYATADGLDLKLDIAYPSTGPGPYPALVFICGNGWGWFIRYNRSQYDFAIQFAARKGYVAVTVDYRYISPYGRTKYLFPAQLHDVKCAVRWLRANAARYSIDPNHIGAIGWSSGGHLALMLGLTGSADNLEGECGDMQYSSRVQAVVNLAGPTDLSSLYKESSLLDRMILELIGATPEEMPELYDSVSPVEYVSPDDPPVLSVQGGSDREVVPKQAEILDAKMKELGVRHTLIILPREEHRNFWAMNEVWEFCDENLKQYE